MKGVVKEISGKILRMNTYWSNFSFILNIPQGILVMCNNKIAFGLSPFEFLVPQRELQPKKKIERGGKGDVKGLWVWDVEPQSNVTWERSQGRASEYPGTVAGLQDYRQGQLLPSRPSLRDLPLKPLHQDSHQQHVHPHKPNK